MIFSQIKNILFLTQKFLSNIRLPILVFSSCFKLVGLFFMVRLLFGSEYKIATRFKLCNVNVESDSVGLTFFKELYNKFVIYIGEQLIYLTWFPFLFLLLIVFITFYSLVINIINFNLPQKFTIKNLIVNLIGNATGITQLIFLVSPFQKTSEILYNFKDLVYILQPDPVDMKISVALQSYHEVIDYKVKLLQQTQKKIDLPELYEYTGDSAKYFCNSLTENHVKEKFTSDLVQQAQAQANLDFKSYLTTFVDLTEPIVQSSSSNSHNYLLLATNFIFLGGFIYLFFQNYRLGQKFDNFHQTTNAKLDQQQINFEQTNKILDDLDTKLSQEYLLTDQRILEIKQKMKIKSRSEKIHFATTETHTDAIESVLTRVERLEIQQFGTTEQISTTGMLSQNRLNAMQLSLNQRNHKDIIRLIEENGTQNQEIRQFKEVELPALKRHDENLGLVVSRLCRRLFGDQL